MSNGPEDTIRVAIVDDQRLFTRGLSGLVDMLPGVEVVGALPESISTPTRLSGFVGAKAKDPKAAKELLDYLSSADAAKVYKERGMVPGR